MFDTQTVERWIGGMVDVWAVLVEVESGAWAGWLEHPTDDIPSRWLITQALAAESAYAGKVMTFDDEEGAPVYAYEAPCLQALAKQMGVTRVIFAMALTGAGLVGKRDYEDIDMTAVIWAKEMLMVLGRQIDVQFSTAATSRN